MKKIFFGTFSIGFLSLCYEIIASKIFFSYFSENSQSVAIIISVFLLGLSIGAFLYGKYNKKINSFKDFFYYSNIFSAFYFYILLSNSNLAFFFFNIINNLSFIGLIKILISIFYLLIPTIFLGFYFPFFLSQISKIYKKNNLNQKLSYLYFFDLIGSVLGSLITGFLFIPIFGIKKTLLTLFILHLLISTLYIKNYKKIFKYLLIIFILFFTTIFFQNNFELKNENENKFIPKEINKTNFNINEFNNNNHIFQTEILFEKPSKYGDIKVIKKTNGSNHSILELYINERIQCNTNKFYQNNISEIHFIETALNILNKTNISSLNIGLGCGLSSSILANNNRVENVEIIEINSIITNTSKFFSNYTNYVLENKKVNLTIDDGYIYLIKTNKTYDLIAIDIENPTITHSSKLYTLENFKNINLKLNKDGIFTLWAFNGNEKYLAVIYNTLNKVFPYVYLKKSGIYDDAYFFASNSKIDINKINLSNKDINLTNIIIKKYPDIEINTIDKPSIQNYWI